MTRHQITMRMASCPARMEAYDRRLAAIHEAGHAVMATHLGYESHAWIHRNDTYAPRDEKTWLGHMTMRSMPGAGHPHARRVAVAGMVAETLWKNGHDEDYLEWYGWEDYLQDDACMSYADWRLADCNPGEPDEGLYDVTAEVAAIIIHLWLPLTDFSRTLMQGSGEIHGLRRGMYRAA